MKNNANNTTYAVIVDPGNGRILYKQALPSFFGGAVGHFGMYGQGKMGPFSGGYDGGDSRGFGGHTGMIIGPSLHMGPMSSMSPRHW